MTPHEKGPQRRAQRRAFQLDERQRARFADHTAAMIVSVAQASNPGGDPVAIAADALRMALETPEPAGPDYDYDTELFADAAAEYAEMESEN